MRYGILAAAFLLTSAGFASADYVIIVANVGGKENELKTVAGGGMAGMQGMQGGMMMGMRGGMMGMMGGSPPNMGVAGMQGGSPPNMGVRGMGPMAPGGAGMAGGPMPGSPNPMGMQGGPRPGMMMGMGGMPGGMMGMGGMPGGMMGMGGMPGGMMGMMGGMMGMGATDVDDAPDYVIAVVEVQPKQGSLVRTLDRQQFAVVGLPKRLGKGCHLLKNPSFGELFVITEGKDKALPTVNSRFQEMFEKTIKEKPTASDLRRVAEWALEHGLVDKFPVVMDKLVEIDKGNPAAVAYLKVKADLDRKAEDDPRTASLKDNLLRGYSIAEKPHYVLVHNVVKNASAEIETHAEHLENAFRGFYYWFALKETALTVPRYRQVIVLTAKEDDFEQLRKILTPGPVVVDGFFARRENLTVMHSQRQDDPYKALTAYWESWKAKGFTSLPDLLAGNGKWSGAPPGMKAAGTQGMVKTMEAQMLALMLKALEQEAELATVSHEASRQLLFASGLLPHNVAVPEWTLFGMGSFFETPLQSPWPTIGAPSPYYLPRWKELKEKRDPMRGGLERTSLETLKKVVTDSYFRSLPPDAKADSAEHRLHEAALRKARTVAWSLTYFLAQQRLEGLRRYFAELSKMPRDIELDDTVLLGCFARAFGCVDANNKVNDNELKRLANDWYGYWQTVSFESETTMREIRKKIAEKMKEAQEKAQKEEEGGGAQQGGMLPGLNPGGGQQPGQPQQRGPQPGGARPPNNPQQGGRPNPPAPPPAPKKP